MRFEELSTQLVQLAPAIDNAVVDELVSELRGWGSPLALSIARVVELVVDGLVDPGIALPALAMACATLADGLRGRAGEHALEAARNEIESLLPVPDQHGEKLPKFVVPDVPLSRVRRRQT